MQRQRETLIISARTRHPVSQAAAGGEAALSTEFWARKLARGAGAVHTWGALPLCSREAWPYPPGSGGHPPAGPSALSSSGAVSPAGE